MATVPNTTTFTLQDVINVVGGASLSDAFANATDARFDPSYKGSKNNLLNFRNYDTTRGAATLSISPGSHNGTGSFTLTVTASAGNTWIASAGSSGGWISFTGSYSQTGSGSFTVNVAARPTGGSATTGSISVTSAAPTQSCSVQRP